MTVTAETTQICINRKDLDDVGATMEELEYVSDKSCTNAYNFEEERICLLE